MGKKNFYAIRRGRQVGVYTSWTEARTHVDGFPGAHFQGFATHAEASAWMQGVVGGVRQQEQPAAAAAAQHQLRPAHPQQPPPPYSYHAAATAAGLQFADSGADPARAAVAAAASRAAHAHPYVKREPAVKRERSSPEPSLPHLSQRGLHTGASSVITDSCCASSQDSLPGLERPDGSRVKREPAAAAAAAASSSAAAAAASPASAVSSSSAAAVASAASLSAAAASPSASPVPIRYGILYADGAAKSNPTGPCGCGGILYEATLSLPSATGAGGGAWVQGQGITCYKRYLGVRSNNEAEYSALIVGLEAALAHGLTHLTVRMDSELVVRHMCGEYRVKAANLLPLYNEALRLAAQFAEINVQHIYREANAEADELANEAITDAQAQAGGFNGAAGMGVGQRQQQPNRYRRDY